ncbi:Csu type fimbrial protein, partial [Phyllobacterium sp. P5_D12]
TGMTGKVRHMKGPNGTKIGYEFYSDSTRTRVYSVGTRIPNDVAPPWVFATLLQRVHGDSNFSIFGVISNKTNVEEGLYTDTVIANFQYVEFWGLFPPPADCTGPVVSVPLQVRVVVKSFCALDVTQHIDFGSWQDLDQPRDQQGAVTVNCDNSTKYAVKLGWGGQGDVNRTRNMVNGNEKISYNLYRDDKRLQPWGDNATTGFLKDQQGEGKKKVIPIYARVPKQATPPPGTYTDNVVVTLEYN